MAFHDDLARHAEQVRARLPHIAGEEATKQALVIPLLQLLGYDVFDPREVKPEYTADFAVKKQGQFEKIDYAICQGGDPVLFIECKPHDRPLEDHSGQLSRYFNATPSVRIAIITNGVRLRVFTDLSQSNIMDSRPWLEIDLLNLKPVEIDALLKLRKEAYQADSVIALAEEMVYYSAMTQHIAAQLREPSESFIRHVASEVLPSTRLTKGLVERLGPILKKAIQSAILENVAKSFTAPQAEAPALADAPAESGEQPTTLGDGPETTATELAAFDQIVRWISDTHAEPNVAFRDSKAYFAVHQSNVRKWFVRFNVQRPPYWVALRHVSPDDLKKLAPGIPHLSPNNFGDSRVALSDPRDLVMLRTAILVAYDLETQRRDEAKEDVPQHGTKPSADCGES